MPETNRHMEQRTGLYWALKLERGAPHLAVEIASKSDHDEEDWDDKLERYQASGIGEIVRFDARDKRRSIRIWDRLDEVLVERAGDDPDLLHCEVLDLWWVAALRALLQQNQRDKT